MFGQQITDLPRLKTYDDAVKHYASIIPIRGTDIRPICGGSYGRRKKQYQIALRENVLEIGERCWASVACVLYNTDVLTFYPNGEIWFNAGGYATSTTHSFATGILRGTDWNCCVTFYREKHTTVVQLPTGEKVAVKGDQTIKLRWKDDPTKPYSSGAYEFIDKPIMYSYFVNRKELNEHRKKVSQFHKTCTAYARLVDPEDYHERPNDAHTLLATASLLPVERVYSLMRGNMEAQGSILEWFLYKATAYKWSTTRDESGYYTDPSAITKLIDDVLKYLFFEEVFNKQEVDKPNTNNNARYSSGKDTYV
jgi:hypothetical protein